MAIFTILTRGPRQVLLRFRLDKFFSQTTSKNAQVFQLFLYIYKTYSFMYTSNNARAMWLLYGYE